jgi:FAD/FMN-containing dehydrogenase
MSLLKEFSGQSTKTLDLKKSDSSDAGKTDVTNKVKADDIGFSLMRNTINSDGQVTGSDVADYLERAAELNDEVDTVPFGLETDDGDIVKVYVNAEQADKFEEAMKKLLGVEDDIEEAINKLALEFDIVDVVWPKQKVDDVEGSDELDLGGDDDFDALDDFEEDPMEVVGEYDELK